MELIFSGLYSQCIGPFFTNQTTFLDGEESNEEDDFMEPDESAPEEGLNRTDIGKNPASDGRQGALTSEIEKSFNTDFFLLY